MDSTLESRFEIPILQIIFNRLETTTIVFEEIRKIKPYRLYIAGDGPRKEFTNEKIQVESVRNYVLNNINWDCEVKTLFRERNLGCKYGVCSAITWLFDNEPWGIILEDDCVPDQSFFLFCKELLQKYQDDTRIMMISGTNLAEQWLNDEQSYHFSLYGSIWGWASWRRAWKYYDVDLKLWKHPAAARNLRNSLIFKKQVNRRVKFLDDTYYGKVDTWDFQWTFTRIINSGLSIVPSLNLISNIGFSSGGTHTKSNFDEGANITRYSIDLPLKENPFIVPDRDYDKFVFSINKYNIKIKLREIINRSIHFFST